MIWALSVAAMALRFGALGLWLIKNPRMIDNFLKCNSGRLCAENPVSRWLGIRDGSPGRQRCLSSVSLVQSLLNTLWDSSNYLDAPLLHILLLRRD
jgi:hypothetical protein